MFYLLQRKPFKINEKYFLFYFERFFCFYDIQIFVLTILVKWENDLIRKLRLVSKIMTSQPEK